MDETNNKNVKKLILCVISVLLFIGLTICFVIAYNNTKSSDATTNNEVTNNKSNTNINTSSSSNKSDSKNLNITAGGSYDLSGEYESITVNTNEEVTLNLNDATIMNANGPAINIEKAESVTIVLSGTNNVTAEATEDLDGAIYSKADLVFEGTGSIEVKSNYDGIVSKDTLVIKSGTYTITKIVLKFQMAHLQ